MSKENKDSKPREIPELNSGLSMVIRHNVKVDSLKRYEVWLRQIIKVASQYQGYQGVHVLRPMSGKSDFGILVRFSSKNDADHWLESDERRELVSNIRPDLNNDEQIEIHSGIDYWFTPITPDTKQPDRWKQYLVTTAIIWPLTIFVPYALYPLFHFIPFLNIWGVKHGIIAATIVAMVVYLIMPRVVKKISKWMFR